MAGLLDQALNQLSPKHVGIEEFAESSAYCNKPLFPAQTVLLKLIFLEELTGPEEDILDYWLAGGRNGTQILISPNIRERVQWLRENDYSHFREVVLIGGRRSSKGFCTGVSMAKVMWDTLQLGDPGAHYGIDQGKEIYFACIAGSQEQAQGRQYADFSDAVVRCKAFDPYIVKALETEIRVATSTDLALIAKEKARGNRIQKDIARLRGNAMAANSGTIRGLAMMCYCMDEVAHMLPGESKSAPDKIYEAANPSLDQFGTDGLAFLNSSPYTKIGLFFKKFEEGLLPFDPTRPIDEPLAADEAGGIDTKDRNGVPRMFMLQFPSWGLYEGYQKSKNRVKLKGVLMADPEWDLDEKDDDGQPLWGDKDRNSIRIARAEEQNNPDGFKVEYRGKFAEVTDAYISPGRVDQMFAGLPAEWIYEDGPDAPPRLRLEPFLTNWGKGATNMHKYKFHLDPSSTTAGFGFAIAHTEIIPDHQGVPEEHVVFDLLKRWQPHKFPGKVIHWPTVIAEILQFAELFHPYEITFDQFESADPIQQLQEKLQEKNMSCRVYKKDATAELNWKRWEVCKTSIYAGLVHAPNDTEDAKWCAQELKFLQIQGGTSRFPKVDRQEIGPVQTKDMADPLLPDHEVMTIDGWKRIGDITTDDLVVSRDTYGKICFDHPTATYTRLVDEEIFEYGGTKLNFAVTGNHNMLVERKGKPELVQARHLLGLERIPKTAVVNRLNGPMQKVFESPVASLHIPSTPYGYCQCGCGEFTKVAKRTRSESGEYKGQPVAFMEGHARKWRSCEDLYLSEAYATVSTSILTRVLQRSRMAIYNRAKQLRLKRGRVYDRVWPSVLPACEITDFAAFVGFWLGDGKKVKRNQEGRSLSDGYSVKITQTKPSGIIWVDNLMQRLDWPCKRTVCSNGETQWVVKSYELREYLYRLQEDDELRLPIEAFSEWDLQTNEALLEGLIMSDGTQCGTSDQFSNSSKPLMDDTQRLLTMIGKHGKLSLSAPKGREVTIKGRKCFGKKDQWVLSVLSSSSAVLRSSHIQRVAYSGPVHCITMPQSNFLTRRNGVTMWIGNCVAECIYTLIGNQMANRTRDRLSQSAIYGGAPGGFAIGLDPNPFQRGGDPMGRAGAYHYPTQAEKAANQYSNPARGVTSARRANSRRTNRSRW